MLALAIACTLENIQHFAETDSEDDSSGDGGMGGLGLHFGTPQPADGSGGGGGGGSGGGGGYDPRAAEEPDPFQQVAMMTADEIKTDTTPSSSGGETSAGASEASTQSPARARDNKTGRFTAAGSPQVPMSSPIPPGSILSKAASAEVREDRRRAFKQAVTRANRIARGEDPESYGAMGSISHTVKLDGEGRVDPDAHRAMRKVSFYKLLTHSAVAAGITMDKYRDLAHDYDRLEAYVTDTVATNVLDSAEVDYTPKGTTAIDRFEDAVTIMMRILTRIQHADFMITEERHREEEAGQSMLRTIEKVKGCDVIIAIGGGVQIQAAYDKMRLIVDHIFADNETPAIAIIRKRNSTRMPITSSGWGSSFGICEYYSNLYPEVEEGEKGRYHKGAIQAQINRARVLSMNKNESPSAFMERCLQVLYTDIKNSERRNPRARLIIDAAVRSGSLDITHTAAIAIRRTFDQGGIPFELAQIAAEELVNLGSMTVQYKTLDEQLPKFLKFKNKIDNKSDGLLAIDAYSNPDASGAKKSKSKGTTGHRNEFAGLTRSEAWGDEEDSDAENEGAAEPETDTVLSQLKELTANVNAIMSRQVPKIAQIKKTEANDRKAKMKAKFQHLADGGFKQHKHEPGIVCWYCGEEHRQRDCARYAWDLFNDCRNAHACPEYLDVQEKKGRNPHKPQPGTFKPFPGGKPRRVTIADTEQVQQQAEPREQRTKSQKGMDHADQTEVATELMERNDALEQEIKSLRMALESQSNGMKDDMINSIMCQMDKDFDK